MPLEYKGDISYLIIRGQKYYSSDRPNDIELQISKDNNVHYNTLSKEDNAISKRGNTLILDDYSGIVRVPRNVGLIIESDRDIFGIIDSRAIINGKGDLNLTIAEDNELELCLKTKEIVLLNKIVQYHGIGVISKEEYIGHGKLRHFNELKRKYIDNKYSGLSNSEISEPKYISNEKRIRADFANSKISYNDINVCLEHNLVNIVKNSGISNLFYKNPLEKFTKAEVDARKKIINDRRELEHTLLSIANTEEYERMIAIKQDIDKLAKQLNSAIKTQ
jgi:hypothetical protein